MSSIARNIESGVKGCRIGMAVLTTVSNALGNTSLKILCVMKNASMWNMAMTWKLRQLSGQYRRLLTLNQ